MRMTRTLHNELIHALRAEIEVAGDEHWGIAERWIRDRVRFPVGYEFKPTTNMETIDDDIAFDDDLDGAIVQVIEFFSLDHLA